ncbi:hypothetical protein Q5M87_06625 [Brachyspira innocens]|uniref:DUF4352 domain-containing protein n=1 Tax=Brachyspira innocens TaxID=13264 RepID=A0ABT8Z002_9SPIR|nr:hypothetical protein [Brachyspira innocens]MDO6993682.1 hypothetical protein [Brachyspira innocens]MDO7021060.1 hypothetical protein [Brachyspira innocens]
MPREVYDPKKPELEFYNNRQPKPPAPKREVSIFAKRWFMFLYGAFLTLLVIFFLLYKKGFFNDIPYFSALKTNIPIEVKINNVEFYEDEAVVATIEVKNSNYTNSINIENLNASLSLYKNKKLIFTGNDSFYNIRFPLGQRIGFKMSFDKNYWKEANNLEVILYLDNNLITTNNIDIRRLKR